MKKIIIDYKSFAKSKKTIIFSEKGFCSIINCIPKKSKLNFKKVSRAQFKNTIKNVKNKDKGGYNWI